MAAFIAERGDRGVTASELADVFLHPASATPELCAHLIQSVLARDARVARRPDGKWAAIAPESAAADASYTVLETLAAAAGSGQIIVEWAGVHVDALGRSGEAAGAAIRPEPWPAGLVAPPHLVKELRSAPTLNAAVKAAAGFARNSTIVSLRTGTFQADVARVLVGSGIAAPLLSLEKLGRRLGAGVRSSESLAARLGVPAREPATAAERALFAVEILSAMLADTERLDLGEPEEWVERQHPRRLDVDFSAYEFDRDFIENLPESPGIYVMRDANGAAVYVGKSSNLRERVRDYFRARVSRDERTQRILEAVSRIEVEETGSDLAALLAEYRAIRELQPTINVQFDVHDRVATSRGPRGRWILVLPSTKPHSAEVFLLHGSQAMRRACVPRDDLEPLRPEVADFFFAESPPKAEGETELEELQIIWSWFDRNRDGVNAVDMDLAGGLEGALGLLARYLREDPSGRQRVFHV